MKTVSRFFKRHWITVWLLAAIICMISFVSYAEYIEDKNHVKRVAANIAQMKQSFTSNYLAVGVPTLEVKYFEVEEDKEEYEIIVKIWNYSYENPTKAYNGELQYTLAAQLVDNKGVMLNSAGQSVAAPAISIEKVTDNANRKSFTGYEQTLEITDSFTEKEDYRYKTAEHLYSVKFPASMLTGNSGVYLKLTATPEECPDLAPISAILGVAAKGQAISYGWNGYFNDAMEVTIDGDTSTLTDYDGFNYVISGSGEATLTFEWRADRIEVNAYNLEEYDSDLSIITKEIEDEEGKTEKWKSATINANANEGISRYEFQFYMLKEGAQELEAVSENDYWDKVKSYVKFSAK